MKEKSNDNFEKPSNLVGKKRKPGYDKNKGKENDNDNKKSKGNFNNKDFKSIQEIFARIKGNLNFKCAKLTIDLNDADKVKEAELKDLTRTFFIQKLEKGFDLNYNYLMMLILKFSGLDFEEILSSLNFNDQNFSDVKYLDGIIYQCKFTNTRNKVQKTYAIFEVIFSEIYN